MKTFVRFLWTGFGTGVDAARAVGIAALIVLGVFIIAWYVIAWIIKLFKKSNSQPVAD